jgi:hypothetical protein
MVQAETTLFLPDEQIDDLHFERTLEAMKKRWGGVIHVVLPRSLCSKNRRLKLKVYMRPHVIRSYNSTHLTKYILDYKKRYQGICRVVLGGMGKTELSELKHITSVKIYRDVNNGYGGFKLLNAMSPFVDYKYRFSTAFNRLTSGIDYQQSIAGAHICFPYMLLYKYPGFGDIDSFGFRMSEQVLERLTLRPKEHKLVLIFGNSATYDINSNTSNTVAKRLEDLLNNDKPEQQASVYTVLNFSIGGGTVLDSIFTYLHVAQKLNPDVVISYDGYTDLVHATQCDSGIVNALGIIYHPKMEIFGRSINGSDDFAVDGAMCGVDAYLYRKKQFELIVKSNGADFVSVFQPLIFGKQVFSTEEIGFVGARDKVLGDGAVKLLAKNYEEVSTRAHGILKTFINLHEWIAQFGEEATLFLDLVHQHPSANKMIADKLFREIYLEKHNGTQTQYGCVYDDSDRKYIFGADNCFARLAEKSFDGTNIYFPYIFLRKSSNPSFTSLGFPVRKDFVRHDGAILVVCFASHDAKSADEVYEQGLRLENMLKTELLQCGTDKPVQVLMIWHPDYIMSNFIAAYILFVETLKPDYVICVWSGMNDFLYSTLSDKRLAQKYGIIYQFFYEIWCARAHSVEFQTNCSLGDDNFDIMPTLHSHLRQFQKIVQISCRHVLVYGEASAVSKTDRFFKLLSEYKYLNNDCFLRLSKTLPYLANSFLNEFDCGGGGMKIDFADSKTIIRLVDDIVGIEKMQKGICDT